MSLATKRFRMAIATSFLQILFLLQTTKVYPQDEPAAEPEPVTEAVTAETTVSSQNKCEKDKDTTKPETTTVSKPAGVEETGVSSSGKGDNGLQPPVDPSMWYFNPRCEVKCQTSLQPRWLCNRPPTIQQYCKSINNVAWCCKPWLPHGSSIGFRPDCTPVCGAGDLPCSGSRCAICARIGYHPICCASCPKPEDIPEDTDVTRSDDGTCPDMPDRTCRIYDGHQEECRSVAECAYNCASGACLKKDEIDGDCFEGCFNHCGSKCGCIITEGCTYDSSQGTCKPISDRYCQLTSYPGKVCSRKGGFYSVGGVVCVSLVDKGNCELEKTVVAINLGSETAVMDSKDIEYQPQSSIPRIDKMKIGKDIAFAPADIKTGRAEDAELLSTALTTVDSVCSNETRQCVDFVLPTMNLDGDYELAVRTVEGVYDAATIRYFSVYFANVEVFSEVDIIGLSGEKFQPIKLLVNFKVENKGKTLILNGHGPRPMGPKTILSFCRGECGADPGFLVSAFHIIQQKPYIKEQVDPCTVTSVEACDEGKFGVTECRRQDSIYSIDGKYCKMGATGGECSIQEVIQAINFNGIPITDNRGILYGGGGIKDLIEAVPGMTKLRGPREPVNGAQVGEQTLYGDIIFGDESVDHAHPCVAVKMPVCEDGKYELAIRLADDEADAPEYRRFNIFLQDHPVFEEIDTFVLAGNAKSTAIDLIINFEVINRVSKLKLKNKPVDTELPIPDEKEITLAFCYSKCKAPQAPAMGLTKRSFVVGGYSFVKFLEGGSLNPKCDTPGNDVCLCRMEGACDYNAAGDKCVEKAKECPRRCGSRATRECRRGLENGHYFYAVGGVVCQSVVETGLCADKETLLAINYAGNAHTDIHGVQYITDKGFPYDDPDKVKEGDYDAGTKAREGVPPQDIPLYNLHTFGNSKKGSSCVTYYLPTAGDGFYELSIKSGEPFYNSIGIRDFSFKLNGQYIIQDFDPARIRFVPYAFDLNVNFKVLDISTRIQMEGHPSSDITRPDKTLPFSFCFGSCSWTGVDTNWVIGAFSLLKFSPELPCDEYNNNACACRYNEECDVDSATGQCVDKNIACSINKNPGDDCRRGGEHVYYLDSGFICPSKIDSGKCEVEKVLIAANLNGKTHQDIRGIVFTKGSDIPYDDPKATSKPATATFQGVPPADLDLYQTYIYGDQKVANDTCINFALPTAGDGRYELSLKNGDVSGSRRRGFNIMFNGENLVEHFEPSQVRKAPNAFDLNVPFKISGGGNTLELAGHTDSTISTGDLTIPLQFCFGTCIWPDADVHWTTSGFSLVKFNDGKLCSEYKDDPCGCRQAGCTFNPITGQCINRLDACSNPSPKDPDECRRAGDHIFYADRGVACISLVESGNCDVESIIIAHNLNGIPLLDSHGIAFQDDSNVIFDDPGGTQDVDDTTGDTDYAQSGVPVEDKNLHGTLWYGDSLVDTQCTTFHLPFSGDGYYELSMKIGEPHYDAVGMRSFSIFLNGQYVVQEFDMSQVRLAPNGFDLNVYYKITASETKFEMTGHPEIDIATTDKTIPLTFCFGTCESVDPDWILGAFSVVKLKGKLPCRYFSGDICACRYHLDCEFNIHTEECLDVKDACKHRFYGAKCRRGGDHVFQLVGGVICHNPVEYGECGHHITIFASNFGDGAPTVTDEFAITYKDDSGLYDDDGQNRQSAETDVVVTGIPPRQQGFYAVFIYGDSNIGQTDKCVTYYAVVFGDGEYELSIKLAEVEYALLQKRSFNILFNKRYIVREFEPNRYRFTPNGINLNVNFRVFNGYMLEIEGYSVSQISDNQIPLDFCFGKCSWPGIDINWIVSAASMIKFKNYCDQDNQHADACACHQAGEGKCDFKEHLKENERKSCTLRNVGCYEFETLPNECRRGGSHTFYVNRGLACNIPEASGNCKISKVMLAVNFGDGAEALTDIYGIMFQKDVGVPFDDPIGSKVESKTDKKIEGVPASDENLYSTYIFGDMPDSGSCVTYHVPTDGDGEYELSIRTAEISSGTKLKRQFHFKFNGAFIQQVFDPIKYRPALYGMDLIINFRVLAGGSKMMMRGHEDIDILSPDKKIPLDLCPGKCSFRLDKTWFISAFSVVKFET